MRRISLCIIASLALSLTVAWAGAGSASAAVGQQLLGNPGVETGNGSPDGWSSAYWGSAITASLTWSSDAHTGSRSLKTEITAYGTQGDAKWWPQPVSVTGGAYYALSDWYKSNIPSAISVEYWTSGQDTSKDGTWVNLYSDIDPSPDSWEQYQTVFTMPSTAVKAMFVHFIAGVGWLETDDYAMTEQSAPAGFSTPVISLTFDDGSTTFYDGNASGTGYTSKSAYSLLNSKNFKATAYIPTSLIGATDYMSSDQISYIAGKGHEIASHSVSHGDLTTIADDSTLASEFTDSKSRLEAITNVGVGNVTDFAYPFGTYNARVIDKEQAAGYATGRSVEAGFNSKADVQAYDIRVQNMTPDVSTTQFRSWIDYAKAHNYWLVLVYHRIMPSPGWPRTLLRCTGSSTTDCLGPYDTSSDDFSTQLDYINSAVGASKVMTVKAALSTLASQAPPSSGTVKLTPSSPTINTIVTASPTGFSSLDHTALTYTYSWKINGVAVAGATGSTLNLSQAGVKRGDTITSEIYAKEAGNGLTSATATVTATVANAAPLTGSVGLAPQAPKAGDTLTATASGFSDPDGDSLTHQYTWYLNGNVVAGATSSTLQLTTAVGGDSVKVEVRDSDGRGGTSDPASMSVTVANTPPVKGTVAITPSSPQVGTALTATPTGFTDVDKDTLGYHYQWSINGTPVSGATNATFTPTAVRGDLVAVTVQADDGHGGTSEAAGANVTLVNTPPVKGSVAITPVSPKVGSTLTATPTGFTDVDSDALTYHYQWSINGTPITGATGSTFVLTTALRGNLVAVSVSADDGHQGTTDTVSSNVTVDNTPPNKGSVTIAPPSSKAGGVLTATPAGFTDVDGDQLVLHYQWSINGAAVQGATDASFTLSTAVRGDLVAVSVAATDGHAGTSDSATASITVADTVPVKGSVAISPASAQAGTVLTATPTGFSDVDRDPLTYQYQWSVNGAPIAGAIAATLDHSTAVGGDMVSVSVAADDGYGGTSEAVVASVKLANTAPAKGSVTISPASPQPGATFTATPAGFTDADHDPLTYHYQWSINGTPVATTASLAAPTALGDTVAVVVTADDGQGGISDSATASVTVGNKVPVAGSVAISPSSPVAGTPLAATPTGYSDADGDQLSYQYTWFLNGQQIGTGETLPAAAVLAGQIRVDVKADDGHGGISDIASDTVTVRSAAVPDTTAPTIAATSPIAGSYELGRQLAVGFSCVDASGIAGCTATLTVPGAKPTTVVSGQNVRLSAAGRYVLLVSGTDRAGNAGSITVQFTVTDTAAPRIIVISPKAKTYRLGQKLPVKIVCTDAAGIAACKATLGRVGARATKIGTGRAVKLAKAGRYVLRITATDRSGKSAKKTLYFKVVQH
jgi:peptidoglycan/xylan/chitin deacetylase (PgdA/CDA1 family)